MNPVISKYSDKNNALLIGLGAGTLIKNIQKKNIDIDVVEIDKRLKNVSVKYFNLNPATNVIIDDGRHFLQTTKKKYDIIILDAFLGENPPWHLLTLESFKKIKKLLNPDGVLLIEFYGYIENEIGKVGRSIYKTLLEADFKVDIVATNKEESIERNLIYVASEHGFDFSNLQYDNVKYTDKEINDLNDYLIDKSRIDINDAVLLTDNKPALDKLLMRPAIEWRKSLNKIFRNRLIESDEPIYY